MIKIIKGSNSKLRTAKMARKENLITARLNQSWLPAWSKEELSDSVREQESAVHLGPGHLTGELDDTQPLSPEGSIVSHRSLPPPDLPISL